MYEKGTCLKVKYMHIFNPAKTREKIYFKLIYNNLIG